jgi:hypothetical protein
MDSFYHIKKSSPDPSASLPTHLTTSSLPFCKVLLLFESFILSPIFPENQPHQTYKQIIISLLSLFCHGAIFQLLIESYTSPQISKIYSNSPIIFDSRNFNDNTLSIAAQLTADENDYHSSKLFLLPFLLWIRVHDNPVIRQSIYRPTSTIPSTVCRYNKNFSTRIKVFPLLVGSTVHVGHILHLRTGWCYTHLQYFLTCSIRSFPTSSQKYALDSSPRSHQFVGNKFCNHGVNHSQIQCKNNITLHQCPLPLSASGCFGLRGASNQTFQEMPNALLVKFSTAPNMMERDMVSKMVP